MSKLNWIYLKLSGHDCSVIPTCSNVSDCSKRGICVDFDVCKCQEDWTGKDCTQFSCESLDYCSSNFLYICFHFLYLRTYFTSVNILKLCKTVNCG